MSERFSEAIRLAMAAPVEVGSVTHLMLRPEEGVHVPVKELDLDVSQGILGDRWQSTAWLRLADGSPDPRVQVSMTNLAVIGEFTGPETDSFYRCGDNIYVDFNLTEMHLPAGSRLKIGEAILEISDVVNDACGKFAQRFGPDAFTCVREEANLSYRLRGLFCSVIQSGRVALGDQILKID